MMMDKTIFTCPSYSAKITENFNENMMNNRESPEVPLYGIIWGTIFNVLAVTHVFRVSIHQEVG